MDIIMYKEELEEARNMFRRGNENSTTICVHWKKI